MTQQPQKLEKKNRSAILRNLVFFNGCFTKIRANEILLNKIKCQF